MEFERFNSFGETSTSYAITVLLEIIRSEGNEGLFGFPYLAKKCYLVEKMRKLDLFGFSQNHTSGIASNFIQGRIRIIGWFDLAKIVNKESEGTENYCGELRQKLVTLSCEQVEDRYLNNAINSPDFKRWQGVIDQVNEHPSGKDWHALSVAAHLHNHNNLPIEHTISDIKRHAADRNIPLPKDVFNNAIHLLTELNLYK